MIIIISLRVVLEKCPGGPLKKKEMKEKKEKKEKDNQYNIKEAMAIAILKVIY